MYIKLIFSIVVLVGFIVFTHLYSLDGLDGFIFGKIFKENTIYAAGFSDSRFRKISKGMTNKKVNQLLGSPLERYDLTKYAGPNIYGKCWSGLPLKGFKRFRIGNIVAV
jgi:hypothetical protein